MAPDSKTPALLQRQVGSYVGVGVLATTLHYLVLVGLVQADVMSPVPAALCGFVAGGCVSYGLNRRHTFDSDRPHREAVWRFAVVASVGLVLTYLAMRALVDGLRMPYLIGQCLTTVAVMFWTFAANRLWTFRGTAQRP